MPHSDDETPRKPDHRRRNLRTAIVLALIALGFYVAFFFSVAHR